MGEHSFGATDSADSAGQPWAGRAFEPNPHAADDGSAPEALAAAQHAFRSGTGSLEAVVNAIRDARLLIPLVAEAGDVGQTANGLTVDKTQELSIVTVATPDDRTALPVFSSVDAMRHWNADARPVPTDGVRAALAAAGEGTPVIILDPASPEQVAIRRPAVWAIAKSEPWEAPHLDVRIGAVLEASRRDAVRAIERHCGDPESQLTGPDLIVELVLDPGLDNAALSALIEQLTSEWYADDYFVERVDRLALKVVPAER